MNKKVYAKSLFEGFVNNLRSLINENEELSRDAASRATVLSDSIPAGLTQLGDEKVKEALIKGGNVGLSYSFIDDTALKGKDDWDKKVRATPKSNTYDYIIERLVELYHLPEGETSYLGFPVTNSMKSNIVDALKTMFNTLDPRWIFPYFIYGSLYTTSAVSPPSKPRNPDGKVDIEAIKDYMLDANEFISGGLIERVLNSKIENKFSAFIMSAVRNKIKTLMQQAKKAGFTGRGSKGATSYSIDAPMDIYSKLHSNAHYAGDSKFFADTIASDLGIELDFDVPETDIENAANNIVKELYDFVMQKASPSIQDLFKAKVMKGLSEKEMLENKDEYPSAAQKYGNSEEGAAQARRDFNSFVIGDKFNRKREELLNKYAKGFAEMQSKMDVGGLHGKSYGKRTVDLDSDDRKKINVSPEDVWADIEAGRLEESVSLRLIKNVLSEQVNKKLNFRPEKPKIKQEPNRPFTDGSKESNYSNNRPQKPKIKQEPNPPFKESFSFFTKNTKISKPIIPIAVDILSKIDGVVKVYSKKQYRELIDFQNYFNASHSHCFYNMDEYEYFHKNGSKYINKDAEESDILKDSGELVAVWDNANGIGYVLPKSGSFKSRRTPSEIKTSEFNPKIDESTDRDKYEDVVFLQGDEADKPLEILDNKGEDAALEYLKQWHYPGEHMGRDELPHGSSDETYEKDGYHMAWNSRIGYIGLTYDLNHGNEIEENFKSDEDIASEFNKMEIEEFIMPGRYNNPQMGTIILNFPEGDESVAGGSQTMVEDFLYNENTGEFRIAFNNWAPEEVYQKITQEIKNRIEAETGKPAKQIRYGDDWADEQIS